MEFLCDSFDDVLLAYGQLQEQSQQPPPEQTQEENEQEQHARERQRRIQEEMDEFTALREWDDRVRLVESLRAQIQVIFWRGIADLERYRQTPSPIDYNPPSERHDLDRIIGEIWTSRLDMDTAETERDSANDSELRLTRDPPSPTSRHTYNPAERSAFVMDYDSGSDGLSEDDLPSDLTPESTRSANGSASEAVPNLDEPASPSDSPLGTIGTMVFNMEFEGPATAVEAHEEVVPETNSDSASDVDMTMSRDRELGLYDTPPRPPIAIRTRNQSKREMAELDMEVFHDEVRGFSIGFHLNVFPWLVMRRIRRMRETALPGSFEHLLMHMFDDIRHVTVYQADVRRTGIQRCHEGASHDDALAGESSPDSSLEAGPCSQRPVVPGERILEGPLSANTLFVQELRVVRLMVAPIRDREIRFAWITSRTERPVELREQFQASKELIANFKRRLVRSLHQSETWTICRESTSPFHETQARSLSLRQYRLDACGATLCWTTNQPDDAEPQELSGQQGDRLSTHGQVHPQPVHVTPDVRFSIAQGNEFTNVADVQGYAEELFTLLVQIAQWLALARGHAAVHLFCDICRLFFLSGVDVSDTAQTDFCAYLLATEVWADESARSDTLLAGVTAEPEDSGIVGAVGHGNDQLERVLMGAESLLIVWGMIVVVAPSRAWQRVGSRDGHAGGGRVALIYLLPLSRSGLDFVVRLMLLKGKKDLRRNKASIVREGVPGYLQM